MAYTNIDDPSAYFQTKTYTGTNNSNALTNDGNSDLKPDFLWIKRRDYDNGHQLLDSTRGVDKILGSELTSAETTLALFLLLPSIDLITCLELIAYTT